MGSEEENDCPRKNWDLFRENKLDFCTKKLRKAAMCASLWCWFAKKNDREFGQLKKTAIACRKNIDLSLSVCWAHVWGMSRFLVNSTYVCCLTVITNSSSNYGKLPWTCRFGTTDSEQGIGVFSGLFSISLSTIDNIYIHDSANLLNIITIDGVETHVLVSFISFIIFS